MPAESPKSDRTNAREAEARWQQAWDARGTWAGVTDLWRDEVEPRTDGLT